MEFEAYDSHWYSLLNLQQGLLLPNTWKEELTKLPLMDSLLLPVLICHGLDKLKTAMDICVSVKRTGTVLIV